MARYGRIIHSKFQVNHIKFENVAARREFAKTFEEYHAGHDHDGEPPRFEEINTSDAESYHIKAASEWGDMYLTIDGFKAYEIAEYHNWDGIKRVSGNPRYRPPTCCISPLIVLESVTIGGNGPFVDSGTLERHELSSIFGSMHEEEFNDLVGSIQETGFTDSHIRMYEGKVLDGWHRYRAALELNVVRKLRFTAWDEEKEGDPVAFVQARNLERRMLTAGQRAQIVYSISERFGHGGNRSKMPNGTLTREELATKANVGVRTIARAAQVEKLGRSEEVIAGEKSASEIIEEMTIEELWKQINPAITAWKQAREGVGCASKTMFTHAALRWEGFESDTKPNAKVLKELLRLLTGTDTNILEELIRKQLDGKDLWDDPPDNLAEKQQRALDAEHRMFQALDELSSDWNYDDFIAAALDKHDWEGTALPDIDSLEDPEIWEERYDLLTREIHAPAAWIQQMLDDMKSESARYKLNRDGCKGELQRLYDKNGHLDQSVVADIFERYPKTYGIDEGTIRALIAEVLAEKAASAPEPEGTETLTDREASKLLKQKKRLLKAMWDTRKEVSRVWAGDGDNDLLSLDLKELEKGFAKNNPAYAEPFQVAIQRTSVNSLETLIDRVLILGIGVEQLEKENRALITYIGDIRNWERPDWSPDTNWILPLIQAKKSKKSAEKEEQKPPLQKVIDEMKTEAPDTEKGEAEILANAEASERKALRQNLEKAIPKWKAKYAETEYNGNAEIQRATEDDLFTALQHHRSRWNDTLLADVDPESIECLKDLCRLLKSASYPFQRRVIEAVKARVEKPENQVHYITVVWGDKPNKMVMFNSDERIEKNPEREANRRKLSELPDTLRDEILKIAQEGETTGEF